LKSSPVHGVSGESRSTLSSRGSKAGALGGLWRNVWVRLVNLAIAIRIDERGGDCEGGPHQGLYALSLPGIGGGTRPGDRIVDVGCGYGYGSRLLAQAGFRVVGCEPGSVPLRAAIRDAGGPVLVRSRGESLPFRDGSFSAAVAIEAVEHSIQPEQFIKEVARVVKPGGLLFVSSPEGNHLGMMHSRFHVQEWNHEELEQLVRTGGWTVVSTSVVDQGEADPSGRPTHLERLSHLVERYGFDAPLPSRMTCIVLARKGG
jgi:SAM-dependent methyltransferase